MKHLKLFENFINEGFWGDRFYWNINVKNITNVDFINLLKKINIPQSLLKSSENDIEISNEEIKLLLSRYKNLRPISEIVLTYDEGNWNLIPIWEDEGRLEDDRFINLGNIKI